MPETIRAILKAQKKRHHRTNYRDLGRRRNWCADCQHDWPCPDYQAAVNALKILDECGWEKDERLVYTGNRLVPDPEEAS